MTRHNYVEEQVTTAALIDLLNVRPDLAGMYGIADAVTATVCA